jgi:FkbM family methyltransferase
MQRTLAVLLRRFLPRTVRRHRIWGGPLKGRYLYASWANYPRAILGRAEPELIDWLWKNVKRGEVWLDVGAHYGYTALAMAHKVGSTGRVFAFEPVLTTAGYLSATARANSLEQQVVVPFALGNTRCLTLEATASRFRGMAHMKQPTENGEPVFTVALDQLWPGLCDERTVVSGVKIDVQGMEAEVLEGMAELLRRDRPKLVVEYHAYADLERLLSSIAAAGYSTRAQPLQTNGPSGDFIHGHNYEFKTDGDIPL